MQPNVAICIHGGAQKTLRGREDRERERERERDRERERMPNVCRYDTKAY